MTPERFQHDAYLIEQRLNPIANEYRVFALAPAGERGEELAFARQKVMAIKEELTFYADESQNEELFRIKARRALDIGGRYDVFAPAGETVGVLQHRFGESMFRSAWALLEPQTENEVALARESNLAIALVRRFIDIPLPYHFAITAGDRPVGEVRRRMSLRDRYELDLRADVERRIDRRVGIALAVALDALEQR